MYSDDALQTYRVFFPTDIFLHVVLGLRTDWQSDKTMNALINSIAINPSYRSARASFKYTCLSDTQRRNQLYNDYLKICDAVTRVVVGSDSFGASRLSSSYPKEPTGIRAESPGCSQKQLYYDVQAGKRVLDRGSTCSYTILEPGGVDPRDCELRQSTETAEAQKGSLKDTSCSRRNARKRSRQSYPADLPVAKRFKSHILPAIAASVGQAPTTIGADDDFGDHHSVSLQIAQYALQVLSSAGFRSHTFGLLVGLNKMQLVYHDRSIVAVSQPFQFMDLQTSQCECLDERRFIAVLICLHRATLAQRGILENLMPDPFLEMYQNYTNGMAKDPMSLFVGRQIKLQVGDKSVLVTLGRTVMHQRGIIGRNTCVVEGTSDAWPDRELVVKISWPASSRVPENAFVDKITEAVKAEGDAAAWVLDHIPTVLHSQEFHLTPDSPGRKLFEYLSSQDVKFADENSCQYELRVCRVSVHERLHSLDTLVKPEDYAQVLFDVFQVHRWIYDYPRIMHRDLSHGNIMWHVRKSRICGVLNDFDLSSSRDASSKQRTGTLPFMAHELHRLDINGDPPIHLYRHDLESIFYIIVLLTCANALKKKPGKDGSYLHAIESSPYHSWFSMTDEQLFYKKYQMMLYNRRSIPVPDNSFKDFAFWIRRLHKSFGQGMNNRTLWQLAADDEDDEDSDDEDSDNEDFNEEDLNEDDEDEDNKNHEDMDVGDKSPALVAFDEETMDGAVSYEAILTIMKTFGKDGRGEKRQLDMMYPVAKED